jgi:glycosyltransferase involved in cell wall biosynthesis
LAQRHDMHVFAQDIEHQLTGVTYHQVPCFLNRPRWINQLWFALATWWMTRRGFDVVHSHENTWHGMVQTVHVVPVKYGLFHGRSGVRLVLQWLKVLTSLRLLTYLALERARYAAPRHIVLASQSVRDIMAQWHPDTRQRLQVITPGIDRLSAPATALVKISAREELGLPPQGRCVLFVGNDFRKKGLPTLLQALSSLPEDVYLAVVGPKAQMPRIQHDMDAAKVHSRVFFVGSLQAMEPAYAAADCLAHPTLEDTFGMVVLEAMAAGVPAVVSARQFCGISALIEHGSQALILHDPHDAQSLAGHLKRALFDLPTRDNLIRRAQLFAGDFQWSRLALQQEALYFEVA